jgi:ATP-dependent RNA helicase DDX49/DBP8
MTEASEPDDDDSETGTEGEKVEAEIEGEENAEVNSENDHDNVDLDSEDEAPTGRFKMFRIASNPPPAHTRPTKLPTNFSSLGISPPLQAALSSMSIRTPTEVQVACIPPLLAGEFYPTSGMHAFLCWPICKAETV